LISKLPSVWEKCQKTTAGIFLTHTVYKSTIKHQRYFRRTYIHGTRMYKLMCNEHITNNWCCSVDRLGMTQ